MTIKIILLRLCLFFFYKKAIFLQLYDIKQWTKLSSCSRISPMIDYKIVQGDFYVF